MRKNIVLVVVIVLIFVLVGLTIVLQYKKLNNSRNDIEYNNTIQTPVDTDTQVDNSKINNEDNTQKEIIQVTDTNTLYLKVNGKVLEAAFVDNSSAEALKERLKSGDITVTLSDYASMEKVGSLGFSLPQNNEYINTNSGDIILYQGNQITVYYGTNSWSLTRIGKIQNVSQSELKNILGNGNVTITLSLSK